MQGLGDRLRSLRRGPDPAPLISAFAAALDLDEPSSRRIIARLSRSTHPRWALCHSLLSYVGSPDGGAVSDLVPVTPFTAGRSDRLAEIFKSLGFDARLIDEIYFDAKLQRYARLLDEPDGDKDPAIVAACIARIERGAFPSRAGLRNLALHADDPPRWLVDITSDLDALEAMARGERSLAPTERQMQTCLELVRRGWSIGVPTATLGLERTASPGWFRPEPLELLFARFADARAFAAALDAARLTGETARLRHQLELDPWSPAPGLGATLDPRRNELSYAITAVGYWWLAGEDAHAKEQREVATAWAALVGLPATVIPTCTFAGLEALADGLALPGDFRDDRLYWWMGQPRAHLELAETLRVPDGPTYKALHVGSADGSQTLFFAAVLDRAIGDRSIRLQVDAVDANWVPPINERSIEIDQRHSVYATGWPLLAEELYDDQDAPSIARRLRTVMSDAQMIQTTADSLPFRRAALGRGPRYKRVGGRWRFGELGERAIRFFRSNIFEPEPFPDEGYALLIMTHVLPWIRLYETGPVKDGQAELLKKTMAIVRPFLLPGATLILDPLSLLEFEGKEWKLIERDPSEGIAYDYRGRKMIDAAPLDGFEVRIVEPEDGMITLGALAEKIKAQS